MFDFIQALKEAYAEEEKDSDKYIRIAQSVANDEDRKMLIEMAKQELVHKAKIENILLGYGEVMAK